MLPQFRSMIPPRPGNVFYFHTLLTLQFSTTTTTKPTVNQGSKRGRSTYKFHAIRNLRKVIEQPQLISKEVVPRTAPQHRGKHSPSVNAFHTNNNPAPTPHQSIMTMFSATRRKTHISQIAGFGCTPVRLSLIIYSLFHIHLSVGFTTYNYCNRRKGKIKGGKYWKGGLQREGKMLSDSNKLYEKDRPEIRKY